MLEINPVEGRGPAVWGSRGRHQADPLELWHKVWFNQMYLTLVNLTKLFLVAHGKKTSITQHNGWQTFT